MYKLENPLHYARLVQMTSFSLSLVLFVVISSSFEMTVESNCAITTATLSHWLKTKRHFFNQ